MKIAFDIRGIAGDRGGKGIWTASVLESLLRERNGGGPSGLEEYYLYTDKNFKNPYAHLAHVHVVRVEGSGFLWHWKAYRKMLEDKIDVFIATESYIIPFLHQPKKLQVGLVVHDLVAFKSPAKHQKKATWIEHFTLKKAVQTSQWIFTVSECTKKDLIERFPAYNLEKKTKVVYAGLRKIFSKKQNSEEVQSVQRRHHLPVEYLLMASTLEPRKNIEGVIKAYGRLSPELQLHYPLVIAGKKGWYYEEIFNLVETLKLQQKVKFLGYVSDEDLVALMQGATVFLFPSFYEGFGLPVLEAMAIGTPVLTSNNSSLPEVGGEAVHYVDPYDTVEMTKGLRQLLENSDYRQKLSEKGCEQAKKFSWKETAKLIMDKIS